MSHRHGLSLRQLRIGKYGKRREIKPCTEELKNFIFALKKVGEDGDVPDEIELALTNCIDNLHLQAPPASIQFHMQKFIHKKK